MRQRPSVLFTALASFVLFGLGCGSGTEEHGQDAAAAASGGSRGGEMGSGGAAGGGGSGGSGGTPESGGLTDSDKEQRKRLP
jgi:hypothetical protein